MISYVYIFFVSEPNLFIVSCFVLNSDPVIFTAPLFIFGSGHVRTPLFIFVSGHIHSTSLYIWIRSCSQHLSLYSYPVIFTAPLFIFGSRSDSITNMYTYTIRIRSYSQHRSVYLDPDPILPQICTHTQFFIYIYYNECVT